MPALVAENGKTYLLVTPVDVTTGNRYNGCRAYEFIDVNCSQLRRNSGKLIEVAPVDGDAGTHNGACAYYVGLPGGSVTGPVRSCGYTRDIQDLQKPG